ncbi:MAG: hypothetical protein COA52_02840 [Hyphomicrobiales bacterium]|nr:glycosyltransferase family 8 protein [Hyphomicrobiales bacterium]PCJ95994.1 MAG: hypothetical protein COA52_02840 [Hyphomicrobiales bacterium]
MDINIAIAPDNNVINPTYALLNSIKENNPNEKINIFILFCELTDENIDNLIIFSKSIDLHISTHRIEFKKVKTLRDKMRSSHITVTALLRCFMSTVLPNDVNKILYLDVDTIVTRSLKELFSTELNTNIAGVVKDPGVSHLTEFGIDGNQYFNSGVMIIDLKLWREKQIENLAFSFMKEHPENCRYWDQCALNYALSGKVEYISEKWNVIANKKNVINQIRNVSIIHYAGIHKPWNNPEHHPFGIYYSIFSQNTPAATEYDHTLLLPVKKVQFSDIGRMFKRLRNSINKRTLGLMK